jgi:hypothetical protein
MKTSMLAAGASLAMAVISSACGSESGPTVPSDPGVSSGEGGSAGGSGVGGSGDGGSDVAPPPSDTSWTKCTSTANCPTDCGPMICAGGACIPTQPKPDETSCVMPGNPKPHFCRSGYCVAGCNSAADCENVICRAESCDAHLCVWTAENAVPCTIGNKNGTCQNGGCIVQN